MKLQFRRANAQDAAQLVDLVNSAYRGETSRQGWTTEADLLDGLRTTAGEIEQLVSSDNSFFLLCFDAAQLIGSAHIERQNDEAHIGMFVVRPDRQGDGIGKRLLESAEQEVLRTWPLRVFVMRVITLRQELIAFYERRGYKRTGKFEQFPVNPEVWTPKVAGLQLDILEKPVLRSA